MSFLWVFYHTAKTDHFWRIWEKSSDKVKRSSRQNWPDHLWKSFFLKLIIVCVTISRRNNQFGTNLVTFSHLLVFLCLIDMTDTNMKWITHMWNFSIDSLHLLIFFSDFLWHSYIFAQYCHKYLNFQSQIKLGKVWSHQIYIQGCIWNVHKIQEKNIQYAIGTTIINN